MLLFEIAGVCWLFSGLNVFVGRTAANGDMDDLETFPRFIVCILCGPFAWML